MSARTRGSRLGDVDEDLVLRGRRAEPVQRGGHDLFEADVALDELDRAGLDPAHVEKVADEVVEPVGLAVDRLEQLAPVVGVERDVALAEARDRRLDRRQGRPQVVGDRDEQRGAQRVRLGQALGCGGLGPQPASLDRERELARERPQHVQVLLGEARAADGEPGVGVEGDRDLRVLGGGGNRVPGAALHPPRAVLAAEHGHRGAPERRAETRHECGHRILLAQQRSAEVGERLGVGLHLGALGAPARRLTDELARRRRRRRRTRPARRGCRPRRS